MNACGEFEGWLFRAEQGLLRMVIRKRWFVLSGTTLEWFANGDRQAKKGVLDLTTRARPLATGLAPRNKKYPHSFNVPSSDDKEKFVLAASSRDEQTVWMEVIAKAILVGSADVATPLVQHGAVAM
jgi:hypothetical protein